MAVKVGETSRQADTPSGATTMVEVARRLGVAPSTVSLALRNDPRVRAQRRKLSQMVAKQMNYRPSASARALRGQRTSTIGVVFASEWRMPAKLLFTCYGPAIQRISSILMRRHYHMALVTGADGSNIGNDQHTARMFQEAMVDGLLVIHRPANKLTKAAEALGAPWVVMDAPVEERKNVVCVDERRAAEQAVEYLIGLGHRVIANLAGATGGPTWRGTEFTQGYVRAMAVAGLPPIPGWDEHEDTKAYLEVLWERRQPPSALITYDDHDALRAIDWLRRRGLRVPEQVSIVGLHDIGYADADLPGLPHITCKANLQEKMAEIAVKKLLHLIKHSDAPPESVVVDPTLVVRQSSGPVSKNPRTSKT